jgi:hypothetical protein
VTFVRNVALFFVLFLPASCATGLSGGWLTGPLPTPRIGYELGLFLVGVMPLHAARTPRRASRRLRHLAVECAARGALPDPGRYGFALGIPRG